MDRETAGQIKSLANEDIDWHSLVKIASLHRLQFLLYQSLKIVCPESVPDGILKQLETRYLRNVAFSLHVTGNFLSILKLLAEKQVTAVPFKGPFLAEMAYGDFALRQFGDLDILVGQQNSLKAIRILEDYGFRPEIHLTEKQLSAYAAKKNSIAMIDNNRGLEVDLHWEMTGGYTFLPLRLETIADNLVHETVAGQKVLQPCTEDLLVYQCLNGAKDCWEGMESLSSVAGLIQSRDGLDWMRVMQLAQNMRCERVLGLGLFMVRDLFNVKLPDTVCDSVEKDSELCGPASWVYHKLFSENNGSPVSEEKTKFSIFHFRVRDSWFEKIRYFKHLALDATVQEWRYFPVPAELSFLHSILRPARLSMALFTRLMVGGLKKLNHRLSR